MVDETDGACSTYRRNEICTQNFKLKNWRQETTCNIWAKLGR